MDALTYKAILQKKKMKIFTSFLCLISFEFRPSRWIGLKKGPIQRTTETHTLDTDSVKLENRETS